ncbi:hypothetical protein ACFTY8_32330 [Streptomyces mirabilis]|uniref:hypothetical protein n=1 Tax=Streptomyces mirabilis TaxID=68239 RepID=UPI0036335092
MGVFLSMRGCLAAERGGDGDTAEGAGLQRGLLVDLQVRVGGVGPSPSPVLQPGAVGLQREFVQDPDAAVDNEPTVAEADADADADAEAAELEARSAPGRASRTRIAAVVDVGLAAVNATAVDDIEEFFPRLRTHGAELVGEVQQFEDSYLLCYVRGPEGILVGLAEQLS